MASQDEIERLIGKVLIEAKFRQEFRVDPAAAAKNLGIELTEVQRKALSQVEFTRLAEELDKMESKSGIGFNRPGITIC